MARRSTCASLLERAVRARAVAALLVFAGSFGAEGANGEDVKPPDAKLPEGHSYHGEAFNEGPRQAAYLYPEGCTGRVRFPATTVDPLAQRYIEQGVGQLHGFWYFEAERSFRQAAALDPSCAIAYWGMAMANINNESRAKAFIAEAAKRKDRASKREAMYIDALKAFHDAAGKDNKERAQRYLKDLERIVLEHPDDIEAKAFVVVQMWFNRGHGIPITSHVAADALLDQVFAVEPMHPAHHYRIHLWDDEWPERALASAARCGQAAPGIAHMWHMSGHTFAGLKRYRDAAWQQEASARVDHAYMMRDRVLPDQIHNFAHNNEWLIRDLLHVGRVRDAIDLAKNMIELPRHPKYNLPAKRWCSASYGRERLFQALSTYELWDETVALCHGMHLEPTEVEEEEVKRLRCLGTAYVRRGDLENGVAQLLELEERRARLAAERERAGREAEERERKAIEAGKVDATASPPQAGSAASGAASAGSDDEKARVDKAVAEARRPFDERVGRLERAMEEIEGHLAVADGALAAGLELLRKAGGVDALYLARLELELEQSRQGGADDEQVGKVLEKAREHVVKRPNEVQPLACFAALLWRAGREREASIAFEDLRALSESIDLESGSPVFARVAPIAAAVELPADWRVRRPPRHDVGDRLDFEALGPFRWQPAPAPAWTLADAFGRTRSLADYRGRPLVVIFYLGFGCLHCAEQIGIFAARAGSFAAAGISLVAVSTDRQADLGKAVKDFSAQSSVQELAFPLVADPALEVFKAYRAYDDFERQPLHGTFLIDGAGLVRWQDISFEPFKDAEFVLREACRLLGRAPPAPERRKL